MTDEKRKGWLDDSNRNKLSSRRLGKIYIYLLGTITIILGFVLPKSQSYAAQIVGILFISSGFLAMSIARDNREHQPQPREDKSDVQ